MTKRREKKLLDRVRDAIRTKHYPIRTEEAYVNWIKRFILFHDKRHPQEMEAAEIEEFLTHLAVDKNVAASTQNQALREEVQRVLAAKSLRACLKNGRLGRCLCH